MALVIPIGLVLLLLVFILSAFQGPKIQDVDRFLKSQYRRHEWDLEFGGINDSAGSNNSKSEKIRDFFRCQEAGFYVFATPHYMIFATVISRNGRARCINFNGPRATEAIGEIKELELAFPKLKYTVVDYP